MSRLRRLLRLPLAEKLLLARAWALLLVADAALRLLPARRVLAARRPRARPGRPALEPERVAGLVDIAARHAPVDATCLKRALVLSWLLGRRGVETTLRIGVARDEGTVAAHAWVERDGRVVGDAAALERYAALYPANDGSATER